MVSARLSLRVDSGRPIPGRGDWRRHKAFRCSRLRCSFQGHVASSLIVPACNLLVYFPCFLADSSFAVHRNLLRWPIGILQGSSKRTLCCFIVTAHETWNCFLFEWEMELNNFLYQTGFQLGFPGWISNQEKNIFTFSHVTCIIYCHAFY